MTMNTITKVERKTTYMRKTNIAGVSFFLGGYSR